MAGDGMAWEPFGSGGMGMPGGEGGMGPEGDLGGSRKLERSDPEASVTASRGDGSEEG